MLRTSTWDCAVHIFALSTAISVVATEATVSRPEWAVRLQSGGWLCRSLPTSSFNDARKKNGHTYHRTLGSWSGRAPIARIHRLEHVRVSTHHFEIRPRLVCFNVVPLLVFRVQSTSNPLHATPSRKCRVSSPGRAAEIRRHPHQDRRGLSAVASSSFPSSRAQTLTNRKTRK